MNHARVHDRRRRTALLLGGALAAALVVAWMALQTGGFDGRQTREGHDARAPARGVTADGSDRAADVRTRVASASDVVDAVRYAFELAIHARDRDDLPAPGAEIWIAPEGHELNRSTTDSDGILRLRWRARVPRMRVVWTSPQDGTQGSRLRRTELRAGAAEAVALRAVHGHRGDPSGASEDVVSEGNVAPQIVAAAVAAARWRDWPAIPALRIDAGGGCVFMAGGEPPTEAGAGGSEVLAQMEVGFCSSVVVGGDPWSAGRQRSARIAGHVRDARGSAARNVLVLCRGEGLSGYTTRTADDGTFAFDEVAPGTYALRAGGGDCGVATAEIVVRASAQHTWSAVLDRGHELTGRLIDVRGQPLGHWDVEATREEPSDGWIDGTTTDADGRFAIPNVGPRPHRLRAAPAGAALGAWFARGVAAGRDATYVVPLVAGELAQITVDARRPDGSRDRFVEAHVWDDAHAEGARVRNQPSGAVVLSHVPPGTFRAVANGPGIGRIELGQIDAPAGTTVQLGPITLPARAIAVLDDAGTADAGVSLVREDGDVPIETPALTAERPHLALSPGSYRFDATDEACVELRPGPTAIATHRTR